MSAIAEQNRQLITAYEMAEPAITPEQLAEASGFDVVSVKACLLQGSSKYRQQLKLNDSAADFSGTHLEEANSTILHIMRYSEDEHLRLKAAFYVRDDKKGRLEIQGNIRNLPMNVIQFNQYLLEAKDAIAAARNGERPLIELEPNEVSA